MTSNKLVSADSLRQLMDAFPGTRIAVVGDLMLDRYVWGSAARISPEAPVPIVRLERETRRLGGAANVAANITGMGGHATVFGTLGQDTHADNLMSELAAAGIDTRGVTVTEPDRPTTVKTRVIAGGQQVVRVDREDTSPLPEKIRRTVIDTVLTALKSGQFDAVIMEDYAKGLLDTEFMQTIADTAAAIGLICSLDPHPSHTTPVTGLSLITPNRSEAFALAGRYCHPPVTPPEKDPFLMATAAQLRADWQVENLLITLGGDGMALFDQADTLIHIPTRAREVFDVSGAGDTVMASFMLARATGADIAAAAVLSNYAAGIVVAKTGTIPVTAAELRRELEEPND
ncbi:MAG: PfkB family carbohydrate kinase [Lentisphaeria bacterium]|nr:PfkB family carbohydrate kinase [Lentisphaeria bacterium]